MQRIDRTGKLLIWFQAIDKFWGGLDPTFYQTAYPGSIRVYDFNQIQSTPLLEHDVSR